MSAKDSEFFQVGGLFTYKTERFQYGFRISSFLKAVREPRWDMNNEEQAMIAEILGEANQIVIRWYWCNASEATHVSGSGVCGVIARVEDITLTGMVNWSESLLEQERDSASRMVGKLSWDLTSAGHEE